MMEKIYHQFDNEGWSLFLGPVIKLAAASTPADPQSDHRSPPLLIVFHTPHPIHARIATIAQTTATVANCSDAAMNGKEFCAAASCAVPASSTSRFHCAIQEIDRYMGTAQPKLMIAAAVTLRMCMIVPSNVGDQSQAKVARPLLLQRA